ncbi:N-acetylmuramoyl-L-alanine amidase [Nakamurella aerolata]|uniref:N-acetylmuramoyl-L-alanine amidase n=1 Tax=Nakamurella aerolata TaxID=1656892 RepID=A0A849AEH3_9ACTN|nr:N-acetylmuramoyl-L-alanine amidase [Nakamurella aerolata]NNG36860.1 N-acetylmuramoyl-L-alanine amidase [Nakamurella aerolata]
MLRLGDAGPEVGQLRRSLSSLGLLPPQTTEESGAEVFDRDVDSAVRAFQQGRQLLVDGKVGPATEQALLDARWKLGDRTLSYTLSAPMTGDDIVDLQNQLSNLGYNTGRPDGLFGARTDAAVRQFQRDCGLPEDGVFGLETGRELQRITKRQLVTGGRPHYLREHQRVRSAGPRLRGKRIVIDPGYGGADTGFLITGPDGEQMSAADLVFDLARRLEGRMTATGMATYLTRGPNDDPDPKQRAGLANSIDADLLLSLHIESNPSPLASGIATFHFGTDTGKTSTLGEQLASLVHRELVARTRMLDCRVHHGAWGVLVLTNMPAIQLELGYLSNPDDRAKLLDPEFRNRVAEGILVAVKRLYMDGRDEPHTGTFTLSDLMAHERSVHGAE